MAVVAQPLPMGESQEILQLPKRNFWQDAWDRLRRNKAAMVGLVIIGFFFVVAIFASVLAPQNPIQINDGIGFLPPTFVGTSLQGKSDPRFFLGTDTLGRDIFSRVIYGARVSMLVSLLPIVIILLMGGAIGIIAGYVGGRVDNFLMRITDVFYAFPDLIFFIVLIVALRDTPMGNWLSGLFLLFVAFAVTGWVGLARLIRGSVLSLKEKEFVEAARAMGASTPRIMFRHILPNALGPIVVWTAFSIPRLIITEAVLGYLGLGLRPTTDPNSFFISSWGSLLLEGQASRNSQPWLLLAPAICVALVVMAYNFLGDGLRDALDPRLRGTE